MDSLARRLLFLFLNDDEQLLDVIPLVGRNSL